MDIRSQVYDRKEVKVNIFGWFKREPEKIIVRDDVLEQVVQLLFPQPVEIKDEQGTYLTDYSVDSNLYSALVDLENGVNDQVVHQTIQKCIQKLYEARDLLYADDRVISNATYLVVDTPPVKNTVDAIKVGGE